MSLYGTEDRFKALGMKAPDLSFLEKPVPLSRRWGQEPLYNPTALVGNWYEDRRAYMRLCPRCTGTSITKSDYTPYCIERNTEVPPANYAQRLRDRGGDPKLLMNTEDYCDYLSNYTTTYDLMHNWEVRRAGCKPKPWRKWKMIMDATWSPERVTLPYGNLTQIGYRKAPQVPLLPNDWDLYANSPTTNQVEFPPPRFPDHYVHCRVVAPREIRRENEDMILVRDPNYDPCECVPLCDQPCRCVCHAIEQAACNPRKTKTSAPPYNTPRFSKYIPLSRLKPSRPIQNVFVTHVGNPHSISKRHPHLPAGPCKSDCKAFMKEGETSPFKKPDICTDYAGDVRQE